MNRNKLRILACVNSLFILFLYSVETRAGVPFDKDGNNGTVSCNAFCAGAQWGNKAGTCTGGNLNTSPSFSCSTVVGFIPSTLGVDVVCHCAGFNKDGNNGTVSCGTFCAGSQWGRVGTCSTGGNLNGSPNIGCNTAVGLLPSALGADVLCHCSTPPNSCTAYIPDCPNNSGFVAPNGYPDTNPNSAGSASICSAQAAVWAKFCGSVGTIKTISIVNGVTFSATFTNPPAKVAAPTPPNSCTAYIPDCPNNSGFVAPNGYPDTNPNSAGSASICSAQAAVWAKFCGSVGTIKTISIVNGATFSATFTNPPAPVIPTVPPPAIVTNTVTTGTTSAGGGCSTNSDCIPGLACGLAYDQVNHYCTTGGLCALANDPGRPIGGSMTTPDGKNYWCNGTKGYFAQNDNGVQCRTVADCASSACGAGPDGVLYCAKQGNCAVSQTDGLPPGSTQPGGGGTKVCSSGAAWATAYTQNPGGGIAAAVNDCGPGATTQANKQFIYSCIPYDSNFGYWRCYQSMDLYNAALGRYFCHAY